MWKLVKAEIEYMSTPILASCGIFIAISLTLPWIAEAKGMRNAGPDSMLGTIAWVVVISIIAQFWLLYLELRESKLRQMMVLPISKLDVGNARMVAPGILWAAYVCLLILCTLVLMTGFPGILSGLQKLGMIAIKRETAGIALSVLAWLSLVYWIRLLSEPIGRIVILCILVLSIAWGLTYNLFGYALQSQVNVWLSNYAASSPWMELNIAVRLILPLVLVRLFFEKRRSYLS